MKDITAAERRRWGMPPEEIIVHPPFVEQVWEPTREELMAWFKDKHVGLWGQFCLTESGRTEAAADWLLGEIESLHAFLGR